MGRMFWILLNILFLGLPAGIAKVLGSGKSSKEEDDLIRKYRLSMSLNPFYRWTPDEFVKVMHLVWGEQEELDKAIRYLAKGERLNNLWVSDRQFKVLGDLHSKDKVFLHQPRLETPTYWQVWSSAHGQYLDYGLTGWCADCDSTVYVEDGHCYKCSAPIEKYVVSPADVEQSWTIKMQDAQHEQLRRRNSFE